MAAPNFWNDQEKVQAVVQQIKALRGWVEPFDSLDARVQEQPSKPLAPRAVAALVVPKGVVAVERDQVERSLHHNAL